jgi:hypothetical protein
VVEVEGVAAGFGGDDRGGICREMLGIQLAKIASGLLEGASQDVAGDLQDAEGVVVNGEAVGVLQKDGARCQAGTAADVDQGELRRKAGLPYRLQLGLMEQLC